MSDMIDTSHPRSQRSVVREHVSPRSPGFGPSTWRIETPDSKGGIHVQAVRPHP